MIRDVMGTAYKTIRNPVNRFLNHVNPPVVVLLYHRVTTLPSDPEMLAVTPENFRDHMRHLNDTFPVVRFEEDWTKVSKPAVAVTFDDGYADNALEALPILEEIRIPATFFVSTGTIGTLQEFWWDELERLVLGDKEIPASISLKDERFGKRWPTGTRKERQEFYNEIVQLMNDVDADRRNKWLDQLRRWAHTEALNAVAHRVMTVDELRHLAQSRWVTIGAHTVTHTCLSALPPEAQREEIVASKSQLETWLDREITAFSYPFGRRCHYQKETMALCREAGFSKVAANFPGQAHRWTDPFQIPRHLVRDWPMEIFRQKLKGFWIR